jgi:hypothetical protein
MTHSRWDKPVFGLKTSSARLAKTSGSATAGAPAPFLKKSGHFQAMNLAEMTDNSA